MSTESGLSAEVEAHVGYLPVALEAITDTLNKEVSPAWNIKVSFTNASG